MSKNDRLFYPRKIKSEKLYVKGVYVEGAEHFRVVSKEDPEKSERRSIVLPLEYGSIYTVTFPNKTDRLRTAVVEQDPRKFAVGDSATYRIGEKLRAAYFEGEPTAWEGILFTTEKEGQFLVLYLSDREEIPVEIQRIPLLLGHDTDDDWYRPGKQPDLKGNADSFANWQWTSDEVMEHIYEPLREAYPEYIERLNIGRDESGRYTMWAYVFTPEHYEQTLFITGGIHASEMDGYLGLARFIDLMVREDGSHRGLHYLRTKVRIVLIPIVNVFSASEEHLRRNSRDKDLNRDFEFHTEGETINVIWLLHQYKDEVAALIDCHTCKGDKYDIYYNFSIQAPNAALCCRVSNHCYEDLKKRGLAKYPTDMAHMPGGYEKADKYLQGYAWNRLGIPTLVIEHMNEHYAENHSALGVELAVEYYGNFIIETALAKLKLIRKNGKA